ncbi:putative HTH-type transcriptional repressor ExuR [Pontiella desulfatans]|uniref:Putative HTH-type transcriptional repressor ExuR n=1 Tax=Pontiella desulfatans TaxID=2750659 RepID=A0A6C2TV40_PONDE|nr:LacI family DNA-binding transcriptional regulator [Pontiella desulfatans]VGO11460.1 putative HTH-type transcriptional repressor ExuR [Pontiella desulfatans]
MAVKGKKRKRTSNRVTLEDIARYCDVSKATVSRVLNGHLNEFPVSEEMIQRVKAAAEQLGYRPNRLARAIRNQRTNLIGLSFIHIDYQSMAEDKVAYENQVMGQFTNCILSHPGFKDYDLVIHDREELKDRALQEADFKSDLLEGLIYLTPSEDHREFLDVASKEFPIVLLGQIEGAEEKVPCIDINNRKMAAKAVDHLLESGRKNILLLIPDKLQHISCIQDRIRGYRDALEAKDIKVSDEFIRSVRSLKDNVENFFSDLRCIDEIDAIFCPTDNLAALCIPALKACGKSIPGDIAIIGFDDLPFAQHTTPPLSTVRRPVDKQAHAAIDLLLKILKKEIPYEPGFHEIETELVIRSSTQID